jgi:hypothetical protein
LVPPDHRRIQATVAHTEAKLHTSGGGLDRYAWDSY